MFDVANPGGFDRIEIDARLKSLLFSSSREQSHSFLFMNQQLCYSRQNKIFSIETVVLNFIHSHLEYYNMFIPLLLIR